MHEVESQVKPGLMRIELNLASVGKWNKAFASRNRRNALLKKSIEFNPGTAKKANSAENETKKGGPWCGPPFVQFGDR
jgi:hypothetical protein